MLSFFVRKQCHNHKCLRIKLAAYEEAEGDGDSGHYTADEGDKAGYAAAESEDADEDGESEAYTADEEEDY